MTLENDRKLQQDIQNDILMGRKFSLADAIAQEGGSFLKGESPIPKLMQAQTAVNLFIDQHLQDSSGALQATLKDWVKADDVKISQYLDAPLIALRKRLEAVITNQEGLYEFVKQVDMKWGQIYGERPYFQDAGQAAHPEDEYTHESVRIQLIKLWEALNNALQI